MKKRSMLWIVFGMAMTVSTGWAQSPPERQLRFVFITTCRDEAFFKPTIQGMEDAAKMLGVHCEFTGTQGVDLPGQADMVRKAVADGYDGVALNIIDPQAFDEVVAEAVHKGVPVVAFNVDDRKTPKARLSAVCQDFFQAGRTLGREALKFIPPGSRVLLTQHDQGISALDDRLAGIQEVLQEKNITWKVVCSTNTPPQAVEIIAQQLKADPAIHFVLGTGQTDTEAAGRVIERDFAGKGYAAAGFDLSPETLRLIKAGVIRFTIDQQPYMQGFYPVVQLTLLRRYGIQPSNIDAGATVITGSDVDRVLELSQKHYR
jgi:simple sugar transport system substrate-binding protein